MLVATAFTCLVAGEAPKAHLGVPPTPPAEFAAAVDSQPPAERAPAEAVGGTAAAPLHVAPETPAAADGVPPAPAAAEPDSEDEGHEATSPAPAKRRRRGRIPAEERFHRGLGAIRTRRHGVAQLAKTSDGDPSNHAEAMRDDSAMWGTSERSEIGNHEDKGSWSYIERSALPAGRRIVKLT